MGRRVGLVNLVLVVVVLDVVALGEQSLVFLFAFLMLLLLLLLLSACLQVVVRALQERSRTVSILLSRFLLVQCQFPEHLVQGWRHHSHNPALACEMYVNLWCCGVVGGCVGVCVLYSEQRKTVSVSVDICRVHNDRDVRASQLHSRE